MKKKKICIVTGTRSEYGLFYYLMKLIKDNPNLELQVIATGMHLSPEFGLTFREIEKDGFSIDKKVEMLLSADTPSAVSKSVGLGLFGFADAFNEHNPDIVFLLGDRFEVFSAAIAATFSKIPIAHIHGGETTEGAFDEAIRHSITKMAHLHFVATEEYKNRVIQLGEQPDRVFMVGGLGIDNIVKSKLLKRKKLEELLDFKLGEKNLLVTFHPVTLEKRTSKKQMKELLSALDELKDTQIIFTMPNSDTDSRVLFRLIEEFVKNHSNSKSYTSLGQLRYLSCIKQMDVVIGNSSSGLTEVPSFKKGTINIGDRQRGRIKADSVIDCEPTKKSILNAMEKSNSQEFKKILNNVINPYGTGGASDAIIKVLENISFDNILKKEFYNLNLS